MLSLDDPRWRDLSHAYGPADDIPPLLAQLRDLPDADGEEAPWFPLWSALAHQGDVFAASFAAVPHVVQAIATAPTRAPAVFFQFPAWIEVCRARDDTEVPPDLAPAYFDALAALPALVAAATAVEWDPDFAQCALSALAAAKGQHGLAEALQELSPDVLDDFFDWLDAR